MGDLMRQTLELRDGLLVEYLQTLGRVHRFVLDGDMVRHGETW